MTVLQVNTIMAWLCIIEIGEDEQRKTKDARDGTNAWFAQPFVYLVESYWALSGARSGRSLGLNELSGRLSEPVWKPIVNNGAVNL